MHTVVVVMTTVVLNPRLCKSRGHIHIVYNTGYSVSRKERYCRLDELNAACY